MMDPSRLKEELGSSHVSNDGQGLLKPEVRFVDDAEEQKNPGTKRKEKASAPKCGEYERFATDWFMSE